MGSDIDWGTVARSDEPLADTVTEELLEVPEFTTDTLDALEAGQEPETEPQREQQTGEPGQQVECEICGRTVRVRKDGNLSAHKCEPKAQRGNRLDKLPERRSAVPRRTRDFTIGVLAWTLEESAAHALARPFNVDPEQVPSELPDADGMIGPPLDMLWPSIPDSAQKFITNLADNSDLIECGLAWFDWLRTLSKWARDMREHQQSLAREAQAHGPTQFAATDGTTGRVVPFTPA